MEALIGSHQYKNAESSCGSADHEAASPVAESLFVVLIAK